MSIISSIYDYLKTCQFLKTLDDVATIVYVDYSKNDETTTYTINVTPCNPVMKTYVTGDTVNQFLFTISSVEAYGDNVDLNTANIKFYEDFSKWIRENNKNGILPIMDDDKTPNKIKCLTDGYMLDNAADGTTARYVIQMQLIYDQEN
ncbi:hypothetical protein CLSAB_19400 [Clostridium saccharobutylicum]|uniref:hypothetical protein n=1 Tax=Clostridium saccharobutylicum TaxID=169679 RepID=UPI00098C3082|nr:hypothetical protein [Clostridium saccharobutylicum]OOM17220.1 hypothetical protein CLSAB_19400 [Clostridium saccharobutylicum]